ncbi:MAG: pyruvate kinase [Candidatus Aenigmarchaeota archaeon]|nr:pyruvate kinase [Candidatus Aenigmarchaeota archaeon]
MRRTKIICTIGPASEDESVLKRLAAAGMNVARLNFSHGDYAEHKPKIDKIKKLNDSLDFPVSILLDMQGPEIRTGMLDKKLNLKEGDTVTLSTEKTNKDAIYVNYKFLPDDVAEGSEIMIDDGLISMEVISKNNTDVICRVLNDAILGSKKTVNLPGADVKLPSFTEKDWNDVRFAIDNKVDFLAVSFVRSSDDIIRLRKFLDKGNSKIKIISKIEHPKAIENFDSILEVSDGIMIARGDLGVEIPFEKVPIFQYDMVKKCNCAKKPVITATHMLNSMIENPRPTRAEVTDVANAVLIGSDAVMLSGETATGRYPVRSLKAMDKVAREIESKIKTHLPRKADNNSIRCIMSHSVVLAATSLDAGAIVCFTESGSTAKVLSGYKPRMPVYALTYKKETIKSLGLTWGVFPYLFKDHKYIKDMIRAGISLLKEKGKIKKGDHVVLTAGTNIGHDETRDDPSDSRKNRTNSVFVYKI